VIHNVDPTQDEQQDMQNILVWKPGFGGMLDARFHCDTYTVSSRNFGSYVASVERQGLRGGRERLPLGIYRSEEHAKSACERHRANGNASTDKRVRE
jgi:hypothetical protein